VHTGDWHVGKAIRGKHRTLEYRSVLNELKEFLQKEAVDILLVAGDIYDSSTPSAEAEDIVYNFFHDISQLRVPTVVIAGNHDSGLRFEAISNIMALAGITIRGFYASGGGREKVIITAKDGTKAQIVLIPFVPERIFVRAQDLVEANKSPSRIYSKEMGKTLCKFASTFSPNGVRMVVGPLVMYGSKLGGGERSLFTGENYAVYPEEIPENIDYLALGHVHLYQCIEAASPIYYCGSPLQMDFGEANTPKGFLFLEAKPGKKCEPTFIEFRSGRNLIEIKGTFEEITALAGSDPSLQNAHLKVTVKADSSTLGLSYQLKKIFPEAVEIRRECPVSPPKSLPNITDWLPQLYKEYCEKQRKESTSEAIIQEFNKLYERETSEGKSIVNG
jgi:exonuclease SbcD